MASKPKKIERGSGIVEVRWGRKPQRGFSLGKRRSPDEISLWLHHTWHLLEAKRIDIPVSPETTDWLKTLSDRDHKKLEKHGLIGRRQDPGHDRLFGLCELWLSNRDVEPSSAEVYGRTIQNLQICFPHDPYVARMSRDDGNTFWVYLNERGSLRTGGPLADTTATKRICTAREILSLGMKLRLVDENPFAKQRSWKFAETTEQNKVEVRREWISAVLEICPDPEFRLIICLARYAGMRIPSEPLVLKWSDVLWDRNRLMLDQAKTKPRVMPLFPEVRQALEELFESLPDGASDDIIVNYRGITGTAWRNRLERLLRQAGILQWPRLWHNMRATCESELFAKHPPHVVCEWLGNSVRVAVKNYTRAMDADFDSASSPTEITEDEDQHPNQHPEVKTNTQF